MIINKPPSPLIDKYATAITPMINEMHRTQQSQLTRIKTNEESLSNPKGSQGNLPPTCNRISSPPN